MSARAAADPAGVLDDVVVLLRSGRPALALHLLEPVAPALRGDLERLERVAGIPLARAALSAELDRTVARLDGLRAEAALLSAELDAMRTAKGVLERELARDHAELRRLEDAMAARRKRLARAAPAARRTGSAKPYQLLAEALASGRLTPERVAALLNVRPGDVPAIAAGRVGLAKATWARLLKEIAR